jgi:hypothetical protein
MKIYWLAIDHERLFFYSDDSEELHDDGHVVDSDATVHTGLVTWLHGRFLRFKSAWQHADKGALHWMRQAWDWLHSFTRPDESMLARLRPAHRIDLHHPAARGGDEVRAAWRDYLNRQWWRHLLWSDRPDLGGPRALARAQLDRLLVCLPGGPPFAGDLGYRARAAEQDSD